MAKKEKEQQARVAESLTRRQQDGIERLKQKKAEKEASGKRGNVRFAYGTARDSTSREK